MAHILFLSQPVSHCPYGAPLDITLVDIDSLFIALPCILIFGTTSTTCYGSAGCRLYDRDTYSSVYGRKQKQSLDQE